MDSEKSRAARVTRAAYPIARSLQTSTLYNGPVREEQEFSRYRFEGGHVVWLAEKNVIEVCDEDGKLQKTVTSRKRRSPS